MTQPEQFTPVQQSANSDHDSLINPLKQAQVLHTVELLAEKPQVHIEKYLAGELKIHRVTRERTIQLPVTLQEEVLVISYHPAQPTELLNEAVQNRPTPAIQINGETVYLEHNQSLDISLYREEAQVTKTAYVVEQVDIGKLVTSQEQQLSVTLAHEELDIKHNALKPEFDHDSL